MSFPEGTEFTHWYSRQLSRPGTIATVAEIDSGRHEGRWAALVIGPGEDAALCDWIESEPFDDREDADEQMDAFLMVWAGERWEGAR